MLETSCPPDVAAARSDVDRAQARLRVPARTPREVLELATKQLTTGFGAWSVHDGRLPPYALDVAQRGAVLRLHVRRPAEELWIGARVQGGFSFFCRAVSERPKCSKADPSGRNGEALAYVKAPFFFFPDYLHQTFDPVLGSARAVQGRRLGTPVSCLEGQRAGIELRLCVTGFGFPSDIQVGPQLRVLATALRSAVAAREVKPPSPLSSPRVLLGSRLDG